jgi:Icc-related predicted phosphoesterase
LIHGGDFLNCFSGNDSLVSFNAWLKEQKQYKHVIVVPGNHDNALESIGTQDAMQAALSNAMLLIDQEVCVEGLRIYGTPWIPKRPDGCMSNAFSTNDTNFKFTAIPKGLDVLVTHSPPYGILDTTHLNDKIGCSDLAWHVSRSKPRLHLFGHNHGEGGTMLCLDETVHVNGSNACGEPAVVLLVGQE